MGRESASYYLTLPPELEDAVLVALREGGAEPSGSAHTWIELRLRDTHRYWIDLRIHRAPEPLLEIRIALTNDEWSIRAPLEAAFTALPAGAAQRRYQCPDLGRPRLHVGGRAGAAPGPPGRAAAGRCRRHPGGGRLSPTRPRRAAACARAAPRAASPS